MAKPVIKTKKSPAPVAAPAPAPAQKATRTRGAVLMKITATKLRDLIGADTEIGVSRKELTQLISKESTQAALANAGL